MRYELLLTLLLLPIISQSATTEIILPTWAEFEIKEQIIAPVGGGSGCTPCHAPSVKPDPTDTGHQAPEKVAPVFVDKDGNPVA